MGPLLVPQSIATAFQARKLYPEGLRHLSQRQRRGNRAERRLVPPLDRLDRRTREWWRIDWTGPP